MKTRNSPSPRTTLIAVPMAALMLGAAEAGTTVGLNFSGAVYYGDAGAPVTATAFGVPVADWQNTPILYDPDYGYYGADSGSIEFDTLGNNNLQISWDGYSWATSGTLPSNTGDAEVTYGILDNTEWSAGLNNINAAFPSGCVLGLISADKVSNTSSVTVTANPGSTQLGNITFQISNGVGIGASQVIDTDDYNSITLTNPHRDVNNPASCALAGLIATDQPVVIKKPLGSTVAAGGTVSLSAGVIGIPPMTYQWYRGATTLGTPATETTNTSFTATYSKAGATSTDAGSYTLVVTNAHGEGTSVAAVVTVAAPATVTWDANTGSPGAQGGSGTWDLSSFNWWNGSTDIQWSNPNFATFAAGPSASTVTLAENITTSGMTVAGDYTFSTASDKTLTFSTPSSVSATGATTFSLPIAGTGALTKTGAGTLSIVSRGPFSGPITVQEGTLAFPNSYDVAESAIQWWLDSSVIHLMAGTTLNCSPGAFGPFGNSDATGVTIHIGRNAVCQPNQALGIAYNLTGGRIGTGTSALHLGSSGGFAPSITSQASDVTSVVDPAGGIALQTVSGQNSYTFTTALGTTANGIDLDITTPITQDNTASIVKAGPGTLRLSAANTYTGDTTVTAGTLAVTGNSINDTNKLVLNGGKLHVTGEEFVEELFFGTTPQASGTWGSTASSATHKDNSRFSGTGMLNVNSGLSGFTAWAASNAPGQTLDMDHDHDGVSNGIEYFMGQSGSGFTANPVPINNVVSWPKGPAYVGIYGSDYVVQTSTNLTDWIPVHQGSLTSNGNPVQYTLPDTETIWFVRLKVTGP